ncbi:hypothetical protein EMIHUDRAFT_97724 [Emiliania huxleyi CCMP1516]|uniref:Phytanoyl-CoA dioxygenase n=2 Tax=Emiliania huxleyi TaxID=2903 RepID=A0A0D3KUT3_EMIH1|nr:hypothetical protein EMIHUDRAFT_97724 [Emiliania huxleyi CCMP1516]EOD39518.1 hypothetical protein EMIHUDRAFT_97724 [Emiliania huxleyi CCMP1516]|eukprot:XP_005791947.1 hypothetical protein EMIHUDRAFT_97724 [Emiliania huxleyi CCMP1516]
MDGPALLPVRGVTGAVRRLDAGSASAYLRLSTGAGLAGMSAEAASVEAAVRGIGWDERALTWLDAKWTDLADCGCGFDTPDAYLDSESKQALPPWVWLPTHGGGAAEAREGAALDVSCRLASPEAEPPAALAAALLERLRAAIALAAEGGAAGRVQSIEVLLVSRCPRLPMLRLPRGLADLTVAAGGGGPAAELSTLERAGLVVLPSAVSPADVAALRELSRRRVEALEARMVREGHEQGLEGGDYSYAEVCSRGKGRWDMLLHAPPSDACDVPELNFAGQAAGAEPSDEALSGRALLRRVAKGARWRGHSRYTYGADGEAVPLAYALCAFVPLVPLSAPRHVGGGEGGGGEGIAGRAVAHGLGCTAFWPGSHRQPACLNLGAAASTRLRAVVSGAPLAAGDALLYDYRTVHCGSPNQQGERPILQFTFCRKGYRDRHRNYGYEQLFYDD